jgi:hypothetical protein
VRLKKINGDGLILQGSFEKGIVFRLGDRRQFKSPHLSIDSDNF